MVEGRVLFAASGEEVVDGGAVVADFGVDRVMDRCHFPDFRCGVVACVEESAVMDGSAEAFAAVEVFFYAGAVELVDGSDGPSMVG